MTGKLGESTKEAVSTSSNCRHSELILLMLVELSWICTGLKDMTSCKLLKSTYFCGLPKISLKAVATPRSLREGCIFLMSPEKEDGACSLFS